MPHLSRVPNASGCRRQEIDALGLTPSVSKLSRGQQRGRQHRGGQRRARALRVYRKALRDVLAMFGDPIRAALAVAVVAVALLGACSPVEPAERGLCPNRCAVSQ